MFSFLWGIAGLGVGIGFVANEILDTNSYKKKAEKAEKRYKYLLEKTKDLEEELDYYEYQYYVARNQAIEYKEQYEKLKNIYINSSYKLTSVKAITIIIIKIISNNILYLSFPYVYII